MTRPRLLALAAALAALLPLTACSLLDDDDVDTTPAPVGTVIPTVAFEIEGFPSYVVLPGRRYDLTITGLRDSIDSTAAGEAGYDDEAADGRAFVGVRWDLEGIPGEAGLVMQPKDVPVTATLLVDGERLGLGDMSAEGANGVYVAVPDDAKDIGLEVEYDGRAQVIDDVEDPVLRRPDGNDDLYNDAPALRFPDCPDLRRQERDGFSWLGARCSVRISTPVPYYGPVGWAPEGSSWVVAQVGISGASGAGIDTADGFVDYEVTGDDATVLLDGQEPVQLLPTEDGEDVGLQDDGGWQATAVFRIDESARPEELVVDRRYQAITEDTAEAEAAGVARVRSLRSRVSVEAR